MLYINHEKKAIFIHIPKTAGSYISNTLVKYYGFTNYLNVLVNKRPDHNSVCMINHFPNILTGNQLYDNSFFNKVIGILNYCQSSEYINQQCGMDSEKWNTYFKFCFIRHPYSRVISAWKHIKQIFPDTLPFDEYIMQNKYNVSNIEYGHLFMSQSVHITNPSGLCGIDMFGRFEHLEEDFKKILNKIGFQRIVHNSKKINSSGNFSLKIDKKSVKIINHLFVDDFRNFHYKMVK
jgi:hypothetical protein